MKFSTKVDGAVTTRPAAYPLSPLPLGLTMDIYTLARWAFTAGIVAVSWAAYYHMAQVAEGLVQ